MNNGKPVATKLLFFTRKECLPCHRIESAVTQLANDQMVDLQRVDADRSPAECDQYHVQSVPWFVVLRGGQPVYDTMRFPDLERFLTGRRAG